MSDEVKVFISGILGTMGSRLAPMLKRAGFAVEGFDSAVKLIEGNPPPLEFTVMQPSMMSLRLEGLTGKSVLVIFNNDTAAAVEQATFAATCGLRVVIGTTGFDEAQLSVLQSVGEIVPIIVSSNFSRAVNLMFSFARQARAVLGPDYEATIIETHHNRKKDRPSGTAKRLAEAIGIDPAGGNVHSIRSGDVVGDHELILIGSHDRLVIGHFAQKRELFCEGAIAAIKWIIQQENPGCYTMEQVFGL